MERGGEDPAIRLRILPSALEHEYEEDDIRRALRFPLGARDNFPRKGVRTVVGPDMNDNPFTVMQNMDNGSVFHAFTFEHQKHSGLLWRR